MDQGVRLLGGNWDWCCDLGPGESARDLLGLGGVWQEFEGKRRGECGRQKWKGSCGSGSGGEGKGTISGSAVVVVMAVRAGRVVRVVAGCRWSWLRLWRWPAAG